MPLWTNIRRLAFAGAVQGVKEPGPLDVITPAQGVVVLDDSSAVVSPAKHPIFFVSASAAVNAARFTGLEIQPRGGAVSLLSIMVKGTGSVTTAMWRDDAQVSFSRNPTVQVTTGGVPNLERPDCGIFDVQLAALPAFFVQSRTNNAQGRQPMPLIMWPGERWFFTANVVNTAMADVFLFREAPNRDRDPA